MIAYESPLSSEIFNLLRAVHKQPNKLLELKRV